MRRRGLFEKMEEGRIVEEIAVYRWHVLSPEDIIILGLIHVKDGVRRTRHVLDSPSLVRLSRPPSFRSEKHDALEFTFLPPSLPPPIHPSQPFPPVMMHDI